MSKITAIDYTETIPMLRIFDMAKVKEFYVDFLGFRVDWEHQFDGTPPTFLQATRGELTLFLTEHHGDCCPGSAVFVWMTGLQEFHDEIMAKGYLSMRPGQISVFDPFGNKIHFNEKVSKS